MPDPFLIPIFSEATAANLSNKRVARDDRKYIVRVLATMLCSYVQSDCVALYHNCTNMY